MSNNEMNQFETIITSIRNILRIEGITGLDSINHCIAFIISRYLTIEKCIEFEIPLEFAFENFLKNQDGLPVDDQTAISKFYNQNVEIDCLFVYLRSKLNFNSFKFKVNAPLNFLNIYKKLSDINIDSLSNNIDIVGAIYELHLKTGTTGSGMRDLGQYFSNREVIKYMIKLCDPKLKSNGEIESILDPSMGTGGFLSMSIKYLNKNHSNINWDINKNNIYGFDIDETVKDLSVLNALLECGKIFNKTFVKNDTLHNDYKISDNVLIEKVDIILANEPFGLKNIIHKNVCQRIKDLKIDGTKAEPLFLQLMMQSLNKNGRCAVIVPDGVLFNDAKLHKLTRKYLCNNLRLSKVISLEDGLFLNTGVKSSILFFINDGKTTEVEFCRIKMSDSEIVEELIIKVNIDDIVKNDYSLFVNKYNIVEEEKIKGLEYMKVGDICKIKNGKNISCSELINGPYPVIGGGQKPMGYHNKYNLDKDKIIIAKIGEYAGFVSFTVSETFITSNGLYLDNILERINVKYFYYYLKYKQTKLYDFQETTGQPKLNSDMLSNYIIPIPSLPLQEQIVEALDIIYDTIETNKKLIKNYEKIKKSIIYFNTFNTDKKKLKDMFEIKSGKFNSRDAKKIGLYPFYNSEACSPIGFTDDYCFDRPDYLILIKDGGSGQSKYGDNIGLGKIFKVSNKSAATSHQVALLPNKLTNNNYFYYYLQNIKNKIMDLAQYTTGLGTIRKTDIENLLIPIPSKEIQEQIVKECDYYDNLIKILTDENNRLLNNNIIKLAFDSIQSDHKNSEESSTNNIEDIESENENEDSEEDKPKIITHNQKQYYLIEDKIYKIKKDKSQGELFGSYINDNVEEIEEIEEIITKKKTKSTVKNNK